MIKWSSVRTESARSSHGAFGDRVPRRAVTAQPGQMLGGRRPMTRLQPGPTQESVWDYPRPPSVEQTGRHLVVTFTGRIVAESTRAWRVCETSHPRSTTCLATTSRRPFSYRPVVRRTASSKDRRLTGRWSWVGAASPRSRGRTSGRALATSGWPALWRSIRAEWTRRASTGSGYGHRPVGSTAAGSPTSDDVNPILPHPDGLKWTQEVRSHI